MKTRSHGHEHVVEDDHRLLATEFPVARIDVAAFHAARIAGLAAVDVGDARCIDRHGTHDRVVLVSRTESHGRHDQQPVRIDAAGLMRLGAADIHALVGTPAHMHEHVGIGLLVRCLAAITFRIGHRPADHEAGALHLRDKIDEAPVITGAVRRVDVESDGMQCIDRIHAHAALEAGTGQLPEPALHLVLQDQVLRTAGHMQKPVDAFAGVRRHGGTKLRIAQRQFVGFSHRIDRRPDERVIDRLVNEFTEQEHAQLSATQTGDVILGAANRLAHSRSNLLKLLSDRQALQCQNTRTVPWYGRILSALRTSITARR
jgi:hypothetical protein